MYTCIYKVYTHDCIFTNMACIHSCIWDILNTLMYMTHVYGTYTWDIYITLAIRPPSSEICT